MGKTPREPEEILENFGNIWTSIQGSCDDIEVIKKEYNLLMRQICSQLEEYYSVPNRTEISEIISKDNLWTYLRDYGIEVEQRQKIYDRIVDAVYNLITKRRDK